MKRWCNNVNWSLDSVLLNIIIIVKWTSRIEFDSLKYLIFTPQYSGIEIDILREANQPGVIYNTKPPEYEHNINTKYI